jgi:hypothetical protein
MKEWYSLMLRNKKFKFYLLLSAFIEEQFFAINILWSSNLASSLF